MNDHVVVETASENKDVPYDVEHPGEKAALEDVYPFDFGGPAYSQNVNETVDADDLDSGTSDALP